MKKEAQEQVDFYKEQLSSFKDMMNRTVAYMEEIEGKLQQKNNEISQSINYAKNIQENLLPDQCIFKNNFSESSYLVKQRSDIGGDMIFAKEFGDIICFGLMDCTGHGIPGALISMIGHTFISNSIKEKNKFDPAGILNLVNRKFHSFFHQSDLGNFLYDSMDGVLCSFNRNTFELTYSTAGRPLWVKKENWEIIKSDKKSIGGIQKDGFKNHILQLEEQDELFIYSDGVVDQFGGPRNKKFMSKRVLKILDPNQSNSFSERIDKLTHELTEWQGNYEQTDDISCLGLKL